MLLEHLWYFDAHTIEKYLTRHGFEVLRTEPIGYWESLATAVQRIFQTIGLEKSFGYSIMERILIKFPIGLMLTISQKR